jgi:rhodanese-related sulfurtransferase
MRYRVAMADVTRISVNEASEKLASGWTYVDVRTVEEFEAGHVPGAFNVPIAVSSPGGMAPNPDFERVMAGAFPKDARIVVGCKAGGRSMRAAAVLLSAGYTQLLEMRPGWDGARDAFGQITEPGWSRASQPVEQGQPAGRSYDDVRSKAG